MGLPGDLDARLLGDGRVGVAKRTNMGAEYYTLLRHLGGERYHTHILRSQLGLPGGAQSVHQLAESGIEAPWLSVTTETPYVTTTGGTGRSLQVLSYGGGYRQSTVTGQTMTFTSPVACDRLGVRAALFTVSGMAKVLIDGNPGAANLLPTAAQQVALGRLDAAALVANGGTLNPGDRLMDTYPGAIAAGSGTFYDHHVPLAENLSLTTHTVKLVNTGYKNAVATGSRFAVEGFTYGHPGLTWDTAGAELLTLRPLLSIAFSAHESAHDVGYNGVPHFFLSSIHGWETQEALTFTLDGNVVAPTVGQTLMGTTGLVVQRATTLRHPVVVPTLNGSITNSDTTMTLSSVPGTWAAPGSVMIQAEVIGYTGIAGNTLTGLTRGTGNGGSAQPHTSGTAVYIAPGTAIGTADATYTVTAAGLLLELTTTWAVDFTCYRSYAVMFPMDGWQLTKASDQAATYLLTANANGQSSRGQVTEVDLWQDPATSTPDVDLTRSRLVAALTINDPANTVNGWAHSAPENVAIEDRLPDNNNSHTHKIYVTRVGSGATLAVAAGTVWTSSALFRAAVVDDPSYVFEAGTTVRRVRARGGHRARPFKLTTT